MSMSDPIADMLTRIRNGLSAQKATITMPNSRVKSSIAKVLKDEGYIADYKITDFKTHGGSSFINLEIELKYFEGRPVIEELQRISKPGCRVYAAKKELPSIRGGLGVAIISTSKGIMSGKAARAADTGGEVLCSIY